MKAPWTAAVSELLWCADALLAPPKLAALDALAATLLPADPAAAWEALLEARTRGVPEEEPVSAAEVFERSEHRTQGKVHRTRDSDAGAPASAPAAGRGARTETPTVLRPEASRVLRPADASTVLQAQAPSHGPGAETTLAASAHDGDARGAAAPWQDAPGGVEPGAPAPSPALARTPGSPRVLARPVGSGDDSWPRPAGGPSSRLASEVPALQGMFRSLVSAREQPAVERSSSSPPTESGSSGSGEPAAGTPQRGAASAAEVQPLSATSSSAGGVRDGTLLGTPRLPSASASAARDEGGLPRLAAGAAGGPIPALHAADPARLELVGASTTVAPAPPSPTRSVMMPGAPDPAWEAVLFDRLLDRLEEHVREQALRAVGFTEGL